MAGLKWWPVDAPMRKLQRFFDRQEPGGRLLSYAIGALPLSVAGLLPCDTPRVRPRVQAISRTA